MQIEVDFDVYKALTLRRKDEADSYSDVIRRLLQIAYEEKTTGEVPPDQTWPGKVGRIGQLAGLDDLDGAWIGKVFFPEQTRFRATYKGQTFRAAIKGERWIGEDGVSHSSPSEAASAISGTKVNGWRFWYARRPEDDDWRRLDEFRK